MKDQLMIIFYLRISFSFILKIAVAQVLTMSAWAQLELGEALTIAVESHPSVLAKRNELQGALERLDVSLWQKYPNVSLQTSATQTLNGNKSLYSVRLDQPLWMGGRIDADIRAAKGRKTLAEATLVEAEQQVLLRTAAAFSEVLRMQYRLEAADENVAEHERLLQLIQRRTENQINPKSDAVMARARFQQARSEALQFRNMAANARADLEQMIGRSIESLKVPAFDSLAVGTLEKSIEKALAFSPVLQRLDAEIVAALADIDSRKAALWPALSARHERVFGANTSYSVNYLALTYQPGAGLSAAAAIQEAKARESAAKNNLETNRKELIDKLRTDWNQRQTTMQDAVVLSELVEATQEMYESFARQFPVGRKSWLELLNARREASQARYSLADARWSGFLSAIKVLVATGEVAANKPLLMTTGITNGQQ
jgi:adhesin transport system outer membrane protein